MLSEIDCRHKAGVNMRLHTFQMSKKRRRELMFGEFKQKNSEWVRKEESIGD